MFWIVVTVATAMSVVSFSLILYNLYKCLKMQKSGSAKEADVETAKYCSKLHESTSVTKEMKRKRNKVDGKYSEPIKTTYCATTSFKSQNNPVKEAGENPPIPVWNANAMVSEQNEGVFNPKTRRSQGDFKQAAAKNAEVACQVDGGVKTKKEKTPWKLGTFSPRSKSRGDSEKPTWKLGTFSPRPKKIKKARKQVPWKLGTFGPKAKPAQDVRGTSE